MLAAFTNKYNVIIAQNGIMRDFSQITRILDGYITIENNHAVSFYPAVQNVMSSKVSINRGMHISC
jgi:hypothetical protein